MAQEYFGIVTVTGRGLITAAIAGGQPVNLTHIALGDGNGAAITPTEDMTELVGEVHRAPINTLLQDPNNAALLQAEAVLPSNVGGFYVREAGVLDEDGNLIAVAKTPESYKPELVEGSGTELALRIPLVLANVDAVTIKVDPTVVLASRDHVAQKITEHDGDAAAHGGMLAQATALIAEHAERTDNPHGVTALQVGAAELGHTHGGLFYDPVSRHNTALNAMDVAVLAAQCGPNAIEDGVVFGFADEQGVEVATFVHDASKGCYMVSNANNGYSMWSGGDTRVSQAVSLTANTTVSKVRALFRRQGAPSGGIRCAIMDSSGSFPSAYPSGTVYKTSPSVDVGTIPQDENGNYLWVEFDLSADGPWVSDVSDRTYTFVFEWEDISSDADNCVYLGCNSTMDTSVANTWMSGNAARYWGGWETHKFNDLCLLLFDEDTSAIPLIPYLKTAPVPAVAPPNFITAILHEEDVDAVTLGVDLQVLVSRDGGVTTTPVELQEEVNRMGERILIGEAEVSAQPEGNVPCFILKGMTGKEFNVYEAALLWR